MLDLKHYAYQILELAKENLERDKALLPVAFLIVEEQGFVVPIQFASEEEKIAAYTDLVKEARRLEADAIITVNDAHMGKVEDPESAYWGKLAAEGAPECIVIAVSGPAIPTWLIRVPYTREGETIMFKDALEEQPVEFGMLPGWASSGKAAN
ncbi:MAG: hypothetical protein HYX26_08890 [Acidobacteriales bacterium]|nr:hypothetical protein [Terriglobales bacterium]